MGWVGALFLMHVPVGWGTVPSLQPCFEDVYVGGREGRDEFKKDWRMGWNLVSDARPCMVGRVSVSPIPF